MKLKATILTLLFWGLMNITAQSQVKFPLNMQLADSLETILPSTSGKEKIDLLNKISYALIRHYSNRSDSLASLSVQLARTIDYQNGLANALFCKGTNDYIMGDFIEGIDVLNEAAELFKEAGDTAMIIDTYYQIAAIIFFSLTDLSEGLRLVQKCLEYAIESGDKRREAQMYSSIQYLYNMKGDNKKSFQYLQYYTRIAAHQSVPKSEKVMVIAAYGRNYSIKGDFHNAIERYLTAWQMVNPDDVEERAYLSQLANYLGEAYLNSGMADSALYYFKYGMMLARKHQNYYGSTFNALGIAKLYLGKHQFNQSECYCDSVLFFGKKIDSIGSFYGIKEYAKFLGMSGELYVPLNKEYKRYLSWRMMSGAYQMLIKINEARNNFKNVVDINKSYRRILDSIQAFQKQKELLDLQYKYQTRQKDDQIQLLSKENQIQSFKIRQNSLLLFSFIAISVLVVLIFILTLRQNKIRSERKVADFKQRLLRSQMNPHFIFNSLTSVQDLILQQDAVKASVYLSRFSDLVRNILNNSMEELITLEEEISTIENYLELQKIRFPEKFDYVIEIDEKLNPESISIPPMLAQPFIENAIEHAFRQMTTKGFIKLSFKKGKKSLSIIVEDNGIGRKKAQELKNHFEKDHKSMATIITSERIMTINKKRKRKIRFDIIDLEDNEGKATGTKVIFEIPLSI